MPARNKTTSTSTTTSSTTTIPSPKMKKTSKPTYSRMIRKAFQDKTSIIKKRKNHPVLSVPAITKWIQSHYSVEPTYCRRFLKYALKKGIKEGWLRSYKRSFIFVDGSISKKKKEKTTISKTTTTSKRLPVKEATKKATKIKRTAPSKAAKVARATKIATSRGINTISTGFRKEDFPEDRIPQNTGPDSGLTEIVFSFDTTGSMSGAINQVKTRIEETVKRLSEVPNIRIGLIAHGDYCDGPERHFQKLDICNDSKRIIDWVKNAQNTGGGDGEENYEFVLHEASKMNWTAGSNRSLVMFGDNIPHLPNITLQQMKDYKISDPQALNWREEADNCWKNGIKIYGIQCLGNSGSPKDFYTSLAKRTCGSYVTLDEFSVVTDTLLAICYREVAPERLETFEKEVEAEGRMTKNLRRMFRQLSGDLSKKIEESEATLETSTPSVETSKVNKKKAPRKPKTTSLSKSTDPVLASSLKYDHVWQYLDGTWRNYDLKASDIVEEVYQNYLSNRGDTDVRAVRSGEWEYMVDFMAMKQTNIQHPNHTVREIRRIPVSK